MNERGEASNKETSSSTSTEQPAMLDAAKTFHSYDPSSKRPCVRPRRAQSQTRTPARRLRPRRRVNAGRISRRTVKVKITAS